MTLQEAVNLVSANKEHYLKHKGSIGFQNENGEMINLPLEMVFSFKWVVNKVIVLSRFLFPKNYAVTAKCSVMVYVMSFTKF